MNPSSPNQRMRRLSVLSFAALSALIAGCSGAADDRVGADVDVINHTRSALSGGDITALTGTYGAECSGRSAAGTDTWTLSVSGGPAADELSVRKNDTACVLTIENIVTAGGTYLGSPAIALDTEDAYKASASAFAMEGQPTAFYGNAKISALSFADDFTISVLVSDEPSASDEGSKGASFATQAGSVSAGTVQASDYAISFASFSMEKDVNAVVQSVSGYAELTEGAVTGQDYAVYEGALTSSSTLAEIEAAFSGAAASGALSSLTSLQLPASSFGLSGLDLDDSPQRTVIIRNTEQGVSSYQLMLITFVP